MDRNHEEIWNKCLAIIKDNVPAVSYRTWFSPIIPVKLERYILTIQVPSPFFYEYLEEHYIDILKMTLRRNLGKDARLEYTIIMDNSQKSNSHPATMQLPAGNRSSLTNKPVNMPLRNNEIKNPFVIPGIKKVHIDPQLNPDKNFDNFVEGDCNRLARSAGYAIANNPGGTTFNPLFLYSESGLGKTHLAQAIGIEAKNRFPEKIILYVSANKFMTQFAEATRNNNRNDFIHFYQMIDVLIVDDVQEFAGKTGTNDIFFHIFNHLHQSGKQIIITSDRAPIDLTGLSKRLLSRFKWGLSAELQVPDFETREAILEKKRYKDGINIAPEVIKYIAANITTNVRELEGALISFLAQSMLTKKELTLDLARQTISKLVKYTRREINVKEIINEVCDYFNIKEELLHSKSRKREIVQARQTAMYFTKKYTNLSLASIGAEIGGKDHATVLHAYKTVKNLCETNKDFNNYILDLEKKLKRYMS